MTAYSIRFSVFNWAFIIPGAVGILCLLFTPLVRSYLKCSIGRAFALMLLSGCLAAACALYWTWQLYEHDVHMTHVQEVRITLMIVFKSLFYPFAIPLAAKLFEGCVGDKMSESERAVGREGIKAWLSVGNLICIGGISLCAWQGYGMSFWGVLIMLLGLVLAYPVVQMLSQTGVGQATTFVPVAPQPAEEGLTVERERVLKLLEESRITPDEASELLSALGETIRRETPVNEPMNATHKFILFGAALVLIGFFLPWFTYDLAREMQRLQGQLQGMMGSMSDSMPGGGDFKFTIPSQNIGLNQGNSFSISGGGVNQGLGWVVLLCGLIPFMLPLIARNLDDQTLRMTTLLVLGAGTIILIYLLTSGLRHVSFGLPVVIAGYALQWVAVFQGRQHVALGTCQPDAATSSRATPL